MTRRWSIPLRGAFFFMALSFGLATVGPEAHQCPVHDHAASGGHASHNAPKSHQHCSCPQACCAVRVGVALPETSLRWTTVAAPVAESTPVPYRVVLPHAPRHLLPFAQPPPHTLA